MRIHASVTHLATAGLAAITVVLVGSPAAAEPSQPVLGSLSLAPTSGPNGAFPTMTTPAGCPPESTLYAGLLHGNGLPAEGQLAVSPSALGMSLAGPFAVEMSYTFQDVIEAAGGSALSGVYTLELRCQDDFSNVKGTYTAQVDFATPTAFTAVGDAAAPAPPVPQDVNPVDPNGGSSAAPAPPSPSAPAPAPDTASSSAPAASAIDQPSEQGNARVVVPESAEQASSSRTPWLVGAAVAGAGALGITAYGLRRRR